MLCGFFSVERMHLHHYEWESVPKNLHCMAAFPEEMIPWLFLPSEVVDHVINSVVY